MSKSNGRMHGKVAIVTGAGCVGPGWGNGRAIAYRFALEGARVFAVDKDLSSMAETLDLIHAEGGDVTPYTCDVTDSEAIAALVAACVTRYGKIDVLVNNVGGPTPGGPIELSESQWSAQLDVNLTSVFLMCRHVMPLMVENGTGSIVNIASTSGIRWTGASQVGYAAAKAGVIQFGKVAAVEMASKGIRINSVLPGQMHTPMVEAILARNQTGGDIDALLEKRQRRIPLPFMGDGRDTANAALFLACDESRFVTGTEIIVDGGMSARCD
ncbi:SDR family NAD(P)-dependent oxidoreductase [Achromobacter sp. UMC71]|uniref:SDR family NAD(P)-dependent oxidoreductase n=1 Tax=Achromobacter sp. UMC71 TaxID=1862320 RepID=UPI0016028F21|nr:SDR family NAD(P)-dependent oxidoreductase [Achromobacter sp. UMC71]MBB1628328.1 3-oxoacyl-ACP reductase [Achromobacter sp. UMC71]